MAFQTPLWVGGSGTIPYSAAQDRMMADGLILTEGISGMNDLKVTQRGAGANDSVDIASGWGAIKGDDSLNQGFYKGYNDATINKQFTVAAPGAGLNRIDMVVVRMYDSEQAIGSPQNIFTIEVINGTPTAGATIANLLGAPALPASAMRLAYLQFNSGSNVITNAQILDMRRPIMTSSIGQDGVRRGLFWDANGFLKQMNVDTGVIGNITPFIPYAYARNTDGFIVDDGGSANKKIPMNLNVATQGVTYVAPTGTPAVPITGQGGGHFVIQEAGFYNIHAGISYDTSNVGTRRWCAIFVNGGRYADQNNPPVGSSVQEVSTSIGMYLQVGDYVECCGFHDGPAVGLGVNQSATFLSLSMASR